MNERPSTARQASIYAIWSRQHATRSMAGRDKFVAATRRVLNDFPYRETVFSSFVEQRRWQDLPGFALRYAGGLLPGRATAMQVAMYDRSREIERICRDVAEFRPDIVLIDTVRLVALAEAIRQRLPQVRVIVDMDDLMSRRYGEFALAQRHLSLGYLEKYIPAPVRDLISGPTFAQGIYGREAQGLRAAEQRVAKIADCVVLVSQREAGLFREMTNGKPAVEVIFPPVTEVRPTCSPLTAPLRFIYLGSDNLPQNAETIRYLLDLWSRKQIGMPLVIYGEMTRNWNAPLNVSFAGFAPALDDVYTSSSVLVAPSFVPGGIKTKALEAFGFGLPVVGNAATFDGLDIAYPLCFDKSDEMESFIASPDLNDRRIRDAQVLGHRFVQDNCAPERFRLRWQEVLDGVAVAARAIA